nr:hypothetical protein [Tanacetum cinerariifolium]
MNQDSYNSNSLGFDEPQPPQSIVIHQPPQELSIQEMEYLKQQYLDELKCLSNLEYRNEIKIAELKENFNEPDNSLSMGDEHLDTISVTESDEFIKSSVEDLIPIPKISSGSTTTHSDISLQEYKVFYDDHVKKISSGSPTTHSDTSLYASFIFDLSVNPFPFADRSDFYEFTDELIPFISPPEYDCFLFKLSPVPVGMSPVPVGQSSTL